MLITIRMTKIDSYLASLTKLITLQHTKLVTIIKTIDYLYKYTHIKFYMLTDILTQL